MNKRVFFLMTALCFALIFLARPQHVVAQCCTYDVVATTALNGCFPLSILTDWSGVQQTDTKTSGMPGHVTYNLASCPRNFSWVSLDGGTTTIALNTPTNITLQPCGVCVRVVATLDGNGCVVIAITLC
jgi:hypothetical protein